MEVTVKITVFLAMTPYHVTVIYQRFGGTYCFHFQVRKQTL